MNITGFFNFSLPNTTYLFPVPIYMTHLLSVNCYISASKLSLFFASNMVFCHSQVTNMEIGGSPIGFRSPPVPRPKTVPVGYTNLENS